MHEYEYVRGTILVRKQRTRLLFFARFFVASRARYIRVASRRKRPRGFIAVYPLGLCTGRNSLQDGTSASLFSTLAQPCFYADRYLPQHPAGISLSPLFRGNSTQNNTPNNLPFPTVAILFQQHQQQHNNNRLPFKPLRFSSLSSAVE
jgi:hypothetical protein